MKRQKIIKRKAEQHAVIGRLYASGNYTTEQLSQLYGITTRQVQRIARMQGVIRTIDESNKLMAPLKNYKKIPSELRANRKQISQKLRYKIISEHPFCTNCGRTVAEGMRLEIDHIDNDATNNEISNLQVLCAACNAGKAHLNRFGV